MKQKEYSHLDERIDKSIILQLRAIAELQNLEFKEAVELCLATGIRFHGSSHPLQARALKVEVVDNKLYQIYPFLYKNYRFAGIDCTIFDKITHFYVDLTPVLYKKRASLPKDTLEVVESGAQEVFNYVKCNFKDEFSEIESFITSNPRNKAVKRLFRPFSSKSEKLPGSHYLYNSTNPVTESESESPEKLKTPEHLKDKEEKEG